MRLTNVGFVAACLCMSAVTVQAQDKEKKCEVTHGE